MKHLKYFGWGFLIIGIFALVVFLCIMAVRYARYIWMPVALLIVYVIGKEFYTKVVKP